jgi:hypothetical protein
MGQVQWTPELAKLRLKTKFWTLARRKCMGHKIDRKFFRRVARAANMPTHFREDSIEIKAIIEDLRKELKRYKHKHFNKRSTWLEGLANAIAQEQESTPKEPGGNEVRKLKVLRQLQHREQQRLQARVIKRATRATSTYQSLDHIDYNEGHQTIDPASQ